jgi:hypothetical protein
MVSSGVVRDGASSSPVETSRWDAGSGRLIVDARGGIAEVGVAFRCSSAPLKEPEDTKGDSLDDSDEIGCTIRNQHAQRKQGHSLLTMGSGNGEVDRSRAESPVHDLDVESTK